jgi:hypothetical protein
VFDGQCAFNNYKKLRIIVYLTPIENLIIVIIMWALLSIRHPI